MDAALSEEQERIRRTLRDVLRERCGPGEVRAAVRTEAGYDEELWRRLAGRVGLAGLAVPARYGGAGCGPTELALACEETGRVLLPSPLLGTAGLVAPLIVALGTEAQRAELLPRLAAGELTGAFAVPAGALPAALGLTAPNDGDWSGGGRAGGVQARPAPTGPGWRLYGEASQVLGGHSADLLLVAARTGGYARGRTLLFVLRPTGARGVTRARLTALDETRPQARVQLRDTEAALLGDAEADVPDALARLGRCVAAVLAAEAVGAADRALERTVAHACTREQFGRPIGSFQAVKHRLADLYVAVQAARSAAYYAAWAVGGGATDDGTAGGLALAQALEALRKVAGEAVQLHGGIGVTWEHEVQLYFKRAASDELLFGPVHRLRARAADEAGLFAGRTAGEAVAL
ncbi:acyl-CoA dehydrogenase [Streptomyces eurocidicus]|uniref:Acyl-CoA dehydrogenase n=1 Tax=Streptomyces eurocidicus TaxID=66423 RepID=A0A2N8NSG4_STREU|nr:acyl-CoA dehydrogenase family protein [Streptomyces eurocidicus]MBB5121623.1 alkylation response protein AidB-like acyl-CoA dehydrogenase [Streptomyces eurocidicus]MBF6054733.1 acyl-CoA dehydrogenase [Streptomyces eurocidicus]PNE31706.1 acyl-CoA dehydrogenase [Streptomyces eurocidicus]